ncbi:hypothetical protein E5329_23045 [Petralouisia muris]|uniref:Uncharacterized protein n=2 Tax=Petralouisia muris TaxID=3032872 RepID=A0AC61RPS5_9FIRM|nr:hypothetical protein E5329_23045 [Petralouisia muris]
MQEYIANTASFLFHLLSSLNTDIQGVKGYVSCARGVIAKQGWYRIAKAGGYGYNSCVISIKRGYFAPGPEYQKIQFVSVYNIHSFKSLIAVSNVHMFIKIRAIWDEATNTEYIELYQDRDSRTNAFLCSIEDALCAYGSGNWKAIPPELTQENIDNMKLLAELDLPANNPI